MPAKPLVRHTVSLPHPFWVNMKEEDEAHSLIYAVDRSLADCLKLLGEVSVVLLCFSLVSASLISHWMLHLTESYVVDIFCRVHISIDIV